MTTYTKTLLSGSTQGRGIKITATSTTGTMIHQAVSGTTNLDEIWLYALNSSGTSVKLTVEWGETTVPDGNIEMTIPGESGLYNVVPGLLLQNSLSVTAFASSPNVIMIHGFVNRITA